MTEDTDARSYATGDFVLVRAQVVENRGNDQLDIVLPCYLGIQRKWHITVVTVSASSVRFVEQ